MKGQKEKAYPLIALLLLAAGLLVRLVIFFQNRSLFIDEANLALNIIEKNAGAFFQPLDYQQYAPPLFLLMEKVNTLLFGNGELALRFLPLLASLLQLHLFYLLVKKFIPQSCLWWLPLYLMAFSPMLIQYATEIKQYSTDVLTSVFFLYLALRWPYDQLSRWRKVAWGTLGMMAIWWSMPVVFVLFAVGCYYGYQSYLKEQWKGVLSLLPIISAWLVSFGAYYLTILSIDLEKSYLVDYHRPYFLPILPTSSVEWSRWLNVWSVFVKTTLGGTVLAYVYGVLLLGLGLKSLWQGQRDKFILLLFPLLACLAASALEQYSLMPRLALFLTPFLLLIIGIGLSDFWQSIPKKWLKISLLAPLIIILVNWKGYQYFINPLGWEDSREILSFVAQRAESTDFIYLSHELKPAYHYYRSYHPRRAEYLLPNPYLAAWDDQASIVLQQRQFPEKSWLMYTHLIGRKERNRVAAELQKLQEQYAIPNQLTPKGAAAYQLIKK